MRLALKDDNHNEVSNYSKFRTAPFGPFWQKLILDLATLLNLMDFQDRTCFDPSNSQIKSEDKLDF